MKTSDPSLLLKGLSILLIGPPGGGKTPLALQFPNPGVIDCDGNLSGPMRWLMKQGLYKPFKFAKASQKEDGSPIELPLVWQNIKDRTDELLKDTEIDTILLDSLTYCDSAIYEHTCRTQGLKELSGFNWQPYKRELHNYISKVRASGKTLIITCHEKIEYDSKGNIEKYIPSISTGIAAYFGYFFSDIWRCTLEDSGGGVIQQKVRTAGTAQFDAKNSLLFGKELINPTWKLISDALTATISPKKV